MNYETPPSVIPAEAGIQILSGKKGIWIPHQVRDDKEAERFYYPKNFYLMTPRNTMPQGRHIAGKKIAKHAMSEFGAGKGEFIFCPHGEAVYYKKSWHHIAKFFTNPPVSKRDKNVVFKLCPAHEMEKNKQYEGEVLIRDIPDAFRGDLRNLVEGMGERAMRKDVLHRILGMKWAGNQLTITTSENQLAQRIGNKIKSTFKKHVAEHVIRPKGGESDFVFVQVSFIKKK